MDIDLYKFFDLPDDCSTKDIKRAYKEKARQLHPDKNRENPIAKEQFQQLKSHYEILYDPLSRKEYDNKWKAKRESAKRHAALDEHRRKLKEKLEAQEDKARREREQQRQQSATNAMADQFRQEWMRHTEQMEHEAHLARKRAREEQQAKQVKNGQSQVQPDTVIRVKWSAAQDPASAACYTQDFLTTCLSEFGEVDAVIMGKRGTAVIEFHSRLDAVRAVDASNETTIGLPNLPLHLSSIETPSATSRSTNPESPNTDRRHQTSNRELPKTTTSQGAPEIPTSNFDSFESDILKRMASFVTP